MKPLKSTSLPTRLTTTLAVYGTSATSRSHLILCHCAEVEGEPQMRKSHGRRRDPTQNRLRVISWSRAPAFTRCFSGSPPQANMSPNVKYTEYDKLITKKLLSIEPGNKNQRQKSPLAVPFLHSPNLSLCVNKKV